MTDNGHRNRDADCLVPTPVLISHVSSKKRHAVDPESVESVYSLTSLNSLTESAGDALITATACTGSMV